MLPINAIPDSPKRILPRVHRERAKHFKISVYWTAASLGRPPKPKMMKATQRDDSVIFHPSAKLELSYCKSTVCIPALTGIPRSDTNARRIFVSVPSTVARQTGNHKSFTNSTDG